MKRYMIFAYEQYDRSGGWNDFAGAIDELNEDAIRSLIEARRKGGYAPDFVHVVDRTTDLVVATLDVQWNGDRTFTILRDTWPGDPS